LGLEHFVLPGLDGFFPIEAMNVTQFMNPVKSGSISEAKMALGVHGVGD
jgi:hypothetical protein